MNPEHFSPEISSPRETEMNTNLAVRFFKQGEKLPEASELRQRRRREILNDFLKNATEK